METITSIFGPKAAFLRDHPHSHPGNSKHDGSGSTDEAGWHRPLLAAASTSAPSSQQQQQTDECPDTDSTGADERVQGLLRDNARLRAENDTLTKKCVQLQSKV
jgi:hypothetical protein